MLIGITGFARSGKDTIAKFLVDEFGFKQIAFANLMRDMLYQLNPIVFNDEWETRRVQSFVDEYGWDKAKVMWPEIRELLQRLGTEAGRKVLGENIWMDTTMKKVKTLGKNVVISDVRYEDECVRVHSEEGLILRVTRPGVTSVNNHASDKGVRSSFIDVEISNQGSIEDLQDTVREIVKLLGLLN